MVQVMRTGDASAGAGRLKTRVKTLWGMLDGTPDSGNVSRAIMGQR